MDIALGSRGDYAIRAVLDLARHHGRGRRKSREIAAAMEIPRKYLPQILGSLIRRDLVASTSGRAGGYVLSRPPAEISLLDVIEAAEGPVRVDICALRGGPCDWEQICPLHEVWVRGADALVSELSTFSFADLAAIDARIEGGTYPLTTEVRHRRPRGGQRSSDAAPA